jgi:hypothetical protein
MILLYEKRVEVHFTPIGQTRGPRDITKVSFIVYYRLLRYYLLSTINGRGQILAPPYFQKKVAVARVGGVISF